MPPKTPKIDPIPEPNIVDDDLLDLPPASQESVGLNLQAGSFSLNNNKHPMSMPVHSGLMMGAAAGLKNRLNIYNNNSNNNNTFKSKHGAISEIKEDDATNEMYVTKSEMILLCEIASVYSFLCVHFYFSFIF